MRAHRGDSGQLANWRAGAATKHLIPCTRCAAAACHGPGRGLRMVFPSLLCRRSVKDRDTLLDYLLMAYGLAQDGHRARALALLDQCATEAGDAASQADVVFYRGLVARVLGEPRESERALSEAQERYERINDVNHAAVAASYRGLLASEQGDVAHAFDAHHKALQLFLQAGDLAGVGNELARLGLISRQVYLPAAALEFFQQAVEAHLAADDKSHVLLDRLNLAATAIDLRQRDVARAQLEAARALAEKRGDALNQARISYLFGNLAADCGDPATALDLYDAAKSTAANLQDQKLGADVELGMGLTRYALGELDAAALLMADALGQYVRLEDLEGQTSALGNLGLVHLANGNLEKAKTCFESALQLAQKRGDRSGAAKQIGNLGLVQRALGNWIAAEQSHRQALDTFEAVGDGGGQAAQWVNLATLDFLRGQLTQAESRYKHALTLYESGGDLEGQASVKANMGNLAQAHSEWEAALHYYREALALYRQLKHRRGEAGALANIGVIYRKLGQYSEAIQFYDQALSLDRAAHDRLGEASVLNNLALARRQVGDVAAALQDLGAALALYEAAGDLRGQAATLDNLGILLLDGEHPSEAIEYHQRALAIYEGLYLRAGMMSSRGNLAHALSEMAKSEEAQTQLYRALAEARDLADTDAEARLLVLGGDLHRQRGKLGAARSDYEAALKIIEEQRLDLLVPAHREGFLGQERGSVYTRLTETLVIEHVPVQAWRVCEQSRSRMFLDQLAFSPWPRPSSVDPEWWDAVTAVLDQLRALASGSALRDPEAIPAVQERWALLGAGRARLDELLGSAPRAAKDWAELLKGHTASYADLRVCLDPALAA